jgi:hypothetical protein
MGIAYTKKYTIRNPESGDTATVVAVLTRGADVKAYLKDAAQRFDWKAFADQKACYTKVRVGQQKQRKK